MRAPVVMLLALGCAGGCGPMTIAPPDGGGPRALDIVAPGTQIPLGYGQSTLLQVRYHEADGAMAPVNGATVHFGIFSDPAGSTLSADSARTDVNGLAQVTLTGGQAEAAFRVAATAVNAPEADFNVGVSKLGFVEMDPQLSWGAPLAPVTLRALLYPTLSCASLPPSTTVPAQFIRADSRSDTNAATFQFLALLARDYAVVGRAEDASGKLLGYGCVDVLAALAPPGSISMVPLPLSPVRASPLGVFDLTSTLTLPDATTQPALAAWQRLGHCPYGAAQLLLDAIGASEKKSAPAIAAALEAHRDAALASGCRPISTTSLDFKLQQLLTPANAPANALSSITDDLENIIAGLTLASRLTIRAASDSTYSAEHLLQSATVMVGSTAKSYPLAALGRPIIDVKDVPIDYDGKNLDVGRHGFTVGFAPLWGQALGELSISARVPGLTAPLVRALVFAVVDAAKGPGVKSNCASVEELLCVAIGSPAGCSLVSACSGAIDSVTVTLNAGFIAPPGLDLVWTGYATAGDSTSMLQIDTLTNGMWTSTQLASGTFAGAKAP